METETMKADPVSGETITPDSILELTLPLNGGSQIILRFAPPQRNADLRDVVGGVKEVLRYLESVTATMTLQCACRAKIVIPTTLPQDAKLRHICGSESRALEVWRVEAN